jgi:hypothetical protein
MGGTESDQRTHAKDAAISANGFHHVFRPSAAVMALESETFIDGLLKNILG